MIELTDIAEKWRQQNPDIPNVGLVIIWNKQPCGWKNSLREANKERPGTIAVDRDGHIFIAEGGNDYDGVTFSVPVSPPVIGCSSPCPAPRRWPCSSRVIFELCRHDERGITL